MNTHNFTFHGSFKEVQRKQIRRVWRSMSSVFAKTTHNLWSKLPLNIMGTEFHCKIKIKGKRKTPGTVPWSHLKMLLYLPTNKKKTIKKNIKWIIEQIVNVGIVSDVSTKYFAPRRVRADISKTNPINVTKILWWILKCFVFDFCKALDSWLKGQQCNMIPLFRFTRGVYFSVCPPPPGGGEKIWVFGRLGMIH